MKPLIEHLNRIKELRFEHSRLFAADQFSTMASLNSKIARAWDDYNEAKIEAYTRNVCFTCCAKPKARFSVEAPSQLTMLFCSADCRLQFGVSLGLT